MESREEFEHVNEGSHHAHFDESPEGSEHHAESEVTGCGVEKPEVSFSAPRMESVLNNADNSINGNAADVNAGETHQAEFGCDKFRSVNDEPEIKGNHNLNGDDVNADESCKALVHDKLDIEVNQNLDCDAVNADKSPKGIDQSPKTGPAAKVDKTSLEHWRTTSPKVWIYKNIITVTTHTFLSVVPYFQSNHCMFYNKVATGNILWLFPHAVFHFQ